MEFVRFVFQALVGVGFGYLCAYALSPLLAALQVGEIKPAIYAILGFVVLIVGTSPTVRRAFGRGFLLLGSSVFALPLSAMVLSGVALNDTMSNVSDAEAGFAAVGGLVAGGLFTAAAGVVGFILGTILLLVGLVLSLGGRREVVVIERVVSSRREPTL